jgi:cytochrome b6-f complex iron-sulfur subunit
MSERVNEPAQSRRGFLGLVSVGTAGLALVTALSGMVRLVKPRVLPEAASRFSIGPPSEFPAGEERIIADRNVMILSTPDGIAAISLVCTHLGCIVSKSGEGFSCPCHGSKFTAQGKILSGPAPKDLPWLEISRRADGKLLVDLKSDVTPGTFYEV